MESRGVVVFKVSAAAGASRPRQALRGVRVLHLGLHPGLGGDGGLGLRGGAACAARDRREQPMLQLGIVGRQRPRQRPTKTVHLGPADVLAHRRGRRLHASGNRSNAHPRAAVQPQNLSYLAYRQRPLRHRGPSLKSRAESHKWPVVPRRSAPALRTPRSVPV